MTVHGLVPVFLILFQYLLQFFNEPIDNCTWGLFLISADAFDSSANHNVFSAVVPALTWKKKKKLTNTSFSIVKSKPLTVIARCPPNITNALCSEFSVNNDRTGTCPNILNAWLTGDLLP